MDISSKNVGVHQQKLGYINWLIFDLPYIWLVWFNMVYIIPLIIILSYLAAWWEKPTPLKNMSSSVGIIVPNIWKNKKCSKPIYIYIIIYL